MVKKDHSMETNGADHQVVSQINNTFKGYKVKR